MNISPLRLQKTNKLKARLVLAMDKYGLNEYNFADKMGIKEVQSRLTLCKAQKEHGTYQKDYIEKIHTVLDELGIPRIDEPKQDNEVFNGIAQGLKEAKEFMQGKDNGTVAYTKEGKELKGQEAVDYYQSLKKSKNNELKGE